jgi:hypothetical protein
MHTKAVLEQTTTTARDDRERITRGLPNEIETGHLSADLDAKRDLFCDTAAGAQASAKLFSLVEACKANGVDVYCYLVALPEALPYPRTGVGIRTSGYERLNSVQMLPTCRKCTSKTARKMHNRTTSV